MKEKELFIFFKGVSLKPKNKQYLRVRVIRWEFNLKSVKSLNVKFLNQLIKKKLKMIYQWNVPHRRMFPLSTLFVCFCIWFVSRVVTTMLFLWPLPANYVNYIYNTTVYQKTVGNVYIGAINVFLVSHCYNWNRNTASNQ